MGIETEEENEMKHKHYEMIVAKAANMDLALFIKVREQWQAIGCHDNQIINIASHYDYFLCLPQHKDACLHWLNGGSAQVREFVTSVFVDVAWNREWSIDCGFMVENWVLRIKPKKEKRWIATIDGLLSPSAVFDDKSKLESTLKGMSYQIHEIHVEV